MEKNNYPQEYRQLERNLSEVRDRRYPPSFSQNAHNPPHESNPERQASTYKLPSLPQIPDKAQLPAAGNLSPRVALGESAIRRRQGFERFGIYERQQKPFNIISCYPKDYESNKLRNFPKLTLENRLIERGSYHDFHAEQL